MSCNVIKSEDLTFPKIKEKINKAGNLFYQYRACRRDAATISLFLEGGTNMPLEIGGRADKMGNRYEIRCILILTWTIYILAPFAITLGIMVCNKLRQPQNYIEAVDPDSVEMKTAELLSGIDGTMMFRYNSKDTFQALYVYLSECHSGKRVSHKRVLELSYEDVKSAKNGLIVITPDFDNFTAKLIAADEYSKYMTETPILEGVANREYYGRSATFIENKSTIEYGTEQGLSSLIYGEQGVSSLPIQDITGEYIDTDNEYMYYYSAEFVK